ncbi:hypothetical protein M9458_012070 [Cirrhinus mrigala]|uniref:Uncharacterized protein n=1 Tax=Cirrhinus mrigala TaxID=683832 RepID=A0ABD0R5H5_CIRMR
MFLQDVIVKDDVQLFHSLSIRVARVCEELRSMVGIPHTRLAEIWEEKDRLLCVEGQKDGNFKRSGLRKLEYDPYTPEMRATIDGLIKTVDTALRKRNLSGVPEEYMPR